MGNSGLSRLRFFSQIVFFMVFIGGILIAGSSFWPFPGDLFFRLDPLTALIAMFTSGLVISGLMLSLIILALTLILGRFFCGWICPLGASIDFFEWIMSGFHRKQRDKTRLNQASLIKYGMLIMVVAGSAFSFQFIYFFDPVVIMTRTMGMILMPIQKVLSHSSPFVVRGSILFLLFTFVILLLSILARRFWCRILCPLGALFGLVARLSPSGFVQKDCNGCTACQKKCRTGAIEDPKAQITQPQECIRCFDCLDSCPKNTRVFTLNAREGKQAHPARLSRRSFLAWFGSGIVGSAVIARGAGAMPENKFLLRPPHAPDEEDFLDLCVRCQACVNTCPTNALQPMLLQSGLYGLWTPTLTPSMGGCKADCNRCSTVCPTNAIERFDLSSKYDLKIGTAILSRDKCIPYAEAEQCGKCIPKCPTAAIGYTKQGELDLPSKIDFLLCIGCGLCENICNKQTWGKPAIVVTSFGRNMPSGVSRDAIKNYLEKSLKEESREARMITR
jgi:polyferredoxin/formate hydrogenlyase subunit 6/NADH:ubiquinone oxidoreductase subunit I